MRAGAGVRVRVRAGPIGYRAHGPVRGWHVPEAARALLAALSLLGVEIGRPEMRRAHRLGSLVDGRTEGGERGIGGSGRGRPPLTPVLVLGAAGGRGEGPIRPSCQRSALHHASAWATGYREPAVLQGLGERDAAAQRNRKLNVATEGGVPNLPTLLMDPLVNPRCPRVKAPRHLVASPRWVHAVAAVRRRAGHVEAAGLQALGVLKRTASRVVHHKGSRGDMR